MRNYFIFSQTASSYAGIDPQTYWMQNISYECLRETLTAVVVKNFTGGAELNIVRYLLRSIIVKYLLKCASVNEKGYISVYASITRIYI